MDRHVVVGAGALDADGDMTVHDADAAGTLARSFPRRETFLPEQF